jgi:hypothetical protein
MVSGQRDRKAWTLRHKRRRHQGTAGNGTGGRDGNSSEGRTEATTGTREGAMVMWQVTIWNASMADFVTSDRAVMLFTTKEAAETFVASSNSFHPGRFTYSIGLAGK